MRDRSGIVSLAALACDHKNGSMPFPMRAEQKRNEHRPPFCDRLSVEIDPHIRLGLPLLHAREFPLVHANRCSAGTRHRDWRRRSLLADAKLGNLKGLLCVRSLPFLRKFLRDLSRPILFERLGATCNALPKAFLLGTQDAGLSTHCRPAGAASSVNAAPLMIRECLARERISLTCARANSGEAAAERRFIPSWRPAASSGHLHPWSGQRSRRASGA